MNLNLLIRQAQSFTSKLFKDCVRALTDFRSSMVKVRFFNFFIPFQDNCGPTVLFRPKGKTNILIATSKANAHLNIRVLTLRSQRSFPTLFIPSPAGF